MGAPRRRPMSFEMEYGANVVWYIRRRRAVGGRRARGAGAAAAAAARRALAHALRRSDNRNSLVFACSSTDAT